MGNEVGHSLLHHTRTLDHLGCMVRVRVRVWVRVRIRVRMRVRVTGVVETEALLLFNTQKGRHMEHDFNTLR